VEIGEIVEAEVNMRYETCLKLKIVLTLVLGGYSVNGAKRWLREKGEGIGEGCYYKYSKFLVDLPLKEKAEPYREGLMRLNLWLSSDDVKERGLELTAWEILNPIALIELKEKCEAKAEELLKALKRWKHGEKEANGF
jgi:hypothetical protein